ncbi:hypothetical protein GOV09_03125 [Candidatus Woesearchaeota archaeon]|nr:hypothetical protein [Candidatus Woesearchaeota archaeon]
MTYKIYPAIADMVGEEVRIEYSEKEGISFIPQSNRDTVSLDDAKYLTPEFTELSRRRKIDTVLTDLQLELDGGSRKKGGSTLGILRPIGRA